jgi:hypothetical protein
MFLIAMLIVIALVHTAPADQVVPFDLAAAANKDLVYEAGGRASRFGGNPAASETFVQDGYHDGVSTAIGIPLTRRVASPSGFGEYELLPFPASNAIELATSHDTAFTNFFIDVPDGHYSGLGLLVSAVEGDVSFTVCLHYTDGTVFTGWWEADDWYQAGTRSNVVGAITNMNRVDVNTGLLDGREHFNLYEFAVRDVESNRVLSAITIGTHPNRWSADAQHWGALFAANGLRITNGVFPELRSAPLQWLLDRQNPDTGFLPSYDGLDCAYTYDQALAAIAFTACGSNGAARDVLAALSARQETNGSFAAAFNATNGATWSAAYRVDINAWVILAINDYTFRTGDRQFLDCATNGANWILTYQQSDGSVSRGPGYFPTARCIADNHAIGSALFHLGVLATNSTCLDAAARVRGCVESNVWVDAAGWFPEYAGADTPPSLPANTFGLLALGTNGVQGQGYARCLAALLARMYVTNGGFAGFAYSEASRSGDGWVWFEGTAQAALAYALAGDEVSALRFDRQVGYAAHAGGAIPCSTPNKRGVDGDTRGTVAPTAWYVFLHQTPRLNPFQPFSTHFPIEPVAAEDRAAMAWLTEPRRVYQVQRSLDLVTWADAPSASGAGERSRIQPPAGGRMEYRDPEAAASGPAFYRVRIER